MSTVMNETNALRVAALQFAPSWQDVMASLEQLDSHLDALSQQGRIDLIVLPEMFATGFSLDAVAAESENGRVTRWMQQVATRFNAAVVGSIKMSSQGALFNRLRFTAPNDRCVDYDKVHLFGAERKVIAAGRERVVVNFRGFRILLQTCYDLRFPVFCRNQDDYDVLLNVASWPQPRIAHWRALLKARAIENLSFVLGVNRIGVDGNDWRYSGATECLSPLGESLAAAADNSAEWIRCELSKSQLQQVRQEFRFLDDRDEFSLNSVTNRYQDCIE